MRRMYILALLALMGCGPEIKDEDITTGFYTFSARCDVLDGSFNVIVCIEYSSLFSTTLANDCMSDRDIFGGANYSFTDTQGEPGCSSSNRSGICKTSEGKFHFYNNKYTAGAAQTECNSLGGTLQ